MDSEEASGAGVHRHWDPWTYQQYATSTKASTVHSPLNSLIIITASLGPQSHLV